LTNNFIAWSKILLLRARHNIHGNRELIASDNNFAVYTFIRFSNRKFIVYILEENVDYAVNNIV